MTVIVNDTVSSQVMSDEYVAGQRRSVRIRALSTVRSTHGLETG
jgi:hypothetical protein